MNRLTKKNENILTNDIEKYITNPFDQIKVNNKLGQLEDVEEELGIDLVTLFKALENGCYFKYNNLIYFCPSKEIRIGYKTIDFYSVYIALNGICCSLYNYGKTWALTREELENE